MPKSSSKEKKNPKKRQTTETGSERTERKDIACQPLPENAERVVSPYSPRPHGSGDMNCFPFLTARW
ncbi:MAG: hypothetical protein KJ057_08730 [Phycisphaerae bacterium]|nr:hypothetical protein [Planctomycetia bacterium]MCK6465439.1 hypothetical protein [Phycisphaerae bacterium]MCL4718544.1 hypothetical protein [Phycisphaerae bacterium]